MDRIGRVLGYGANTAAADDDTLTPPPGDESSQQRALGEGGGGGDNDAGSWDLVMAGTRGAARAATQTQEGDPQGDQRPTAPVGQGATQPPTQPEEFSGIATALRKQGHQNYEAQLIASELALQRDIQGNSTRQAAFKDLATNYTQLRVYLAMVGEQKTVTMIHTLGTFYSIRAATNAYQGKVLGFVGDRRATKEPTPICLPQVKAWQWYTGQVNVDKDDFMEFFETESNRTKWWTPASQLTSETKVPYLLALPNAMVEILREAGGASTPADVMAAMDEVMLRLGGGIMEDQWTTVVEWCLVASQADGNNRKSLLSIEVDSVAIDDDEFDTWVESKLDMALGRRPSRNSHHQGAQAQQTNHMNDQLNMARLLASTVGQGMLHFTQAVAGQTTTGATGQLTQGAIPFDMSKGFDRDQIAKLKDACGVMSAKDIPPIWAVIQATKGKAHDTYRDHLKKSIEAWCRSRHIERDKSIYLTAKFFEDLVALRFNPGGPVAQYESAARGISMISCRSLSAVEAETQRGYEEATELTKTTRKLEDILKEKGKTPNPAPDYMQLKLNIGTFCALLWSLFGDHCDYYKELVKLHHILDREECFTIRDAYTKEICARITWAIIDDGRSFFGRNPVSTDFTPGIQFQFSVSCLGSITDAVRNAQPVQRATFPKQWSTPVIPEGQGAPGKPQRHMPQPVPTVPPPAGWGLPPPHKPGGPQGPPRRPGQEDIRHPKIKALMDPYLAKYNNYINLSDILTASGKRITDLPGLEGYTNPSGSSCICWNTVLGKCFKGKRCRYYKGHVRKADITDGFAEAVTDCIGKGVVYYTDLPKGGSPEGKRKQPPEGKDDA